MDEELKKILMNGAEDQLVKAADLLIAVSQHLAAKSDNSVDDLIVNALVMLKPELLKVIDKVDGEVG